MAIYLHAVPAKRTEVGGKVEADLGDLRGGGERGPLPPEGVDHVAVPSDPVDVAEARVVDEGPRKIASRCHAARDRVAHPEDLLAARERGADQVARISIKLSQVVARQRLELGRSLDLRDRLPVSAEDHLAQRR